MNIEDTMTIEELRSELRRAWDLRFALRDAFRGLPDVPSQKALRALVDLGGSFPDMWEIGKTEQRQHPWGTVPAKTEYEIAQGLWAIIRDALRAHRASVAASAIEAGTGETEGLDAKRESAVPEADAQSPSQNLSEGSI